MSEQNGVIAVYVNHAEVEGALKELQQTGFDMRTVSVVGKDRHTERDVVEYYNAGDRMKRWAKSGALSGGIWGLLLGSASFAIPGIGSVPVAGPLVGWFVGALEGAVVVGGLSAICAGLYSIGIPTDSIVQYGSAVKSDRFLLLAHGTVEDLNRAQGITRHARPLALTMHAAKAAKTAGIAAH
jgi:hypothetical protein